MNIMSEWVVDIKDFQSLKKVHISIENGLNIITGKTNVGKSAVFRAIDSALFNMGDDSMVRGGKRYSGISIDNGTHKMLFCRDGQGKNEKTAYQFDNGSVQKKVGRSQLPEVAKMFNIRDVRTQNGTKIKINFWYQNDKPFLMDKTAGQLYEFLSLSSCDKYSKILKLMTTDIKVQEADINNITTEIDTLKVVNNRKIDFIDKNIGFDDLYVKIITEDGKRKSLEEIEKIISRVDDIERRMSICRKKIEVIDERYRKIPIQKLGEQYDIIQESYAECVQISQNVKNVSDYRRRIENTNKSYNDVCKNSERVQNVEKESEEKMRKIVSVENDLKSIKDMIDRCVQLREKSKNIHKKIKNIEDRHSIDIKSVGDRIEKINESKSCREYENDVICKINMIRNKIDEKTKSLNYVKDKILDVENQLEELKESAGYCPFCGTVFEKK